MSDLDDKTIYVFVRGDLPEEQQLVQAAHVVLSFGMAYGYMKSPDWCAIAGEPRIIALDGGSSEQALQRTYRKLTEKKIPIRMYTDPDTPEIGITAMVTGPLTKEQSLPLANYRLRRYSAVAQDQSVADAPKKLSAEGGGSSPSGGAKFASVAQTGNTEHSATNREVAGAIPAGSSRINCS